MFIKENFDYALHSKLRKEVTTFLKGEGYTFTKSYSDKRVNTVYRNKYYNVGPLRKKVEDVVTKLNSKFQDFNFEVHVSNTKWNKNIPSIIFTPKFK